MRVQVAVYGGSFNPPHIAHAMVAAWLRWTGQADEVWLLPVYRHAFEGRHDKSLAPFEDRCRWARAMAEDLGEGIRVCTIEQELPVPSFTVDTLATLAGRFPEHRFRLVVGADVLPQVPHWKDWARIERNFSPIVAGRQGFALPASIDSIDFPDVSSTDLRQRLNQGLPIDHLVTRSVARLLRAEARELPWQVSP